MAEKKMWGGRFVQKTAASVEEYTCSQQYDRALYREDIAGSQAHARMLGRQGIITQQESRLLVEGLETIREEIEQGKFVWQDSLEDVHMNIESRLTELLGPVGGKLHTGRSRNDQVALDFRLYIKGCLKEWQCLLAGLTTVFVSVAKEHSRTLLPGCTHLQPAQPVSLAQHLLAYAQMFRRDYERVQNSVQRTDSSPLGAAALAGTSYPLDPDSVARELGFSGVFDNSMDAVSDRDFVIEGVFCGAVIMAHLSRLCEEIILWAHPAFGFIILPDGFATGSSIMPQKKNPDVAELMRGRTGRVYGSLTSLLTLIKALPLTYNRDLQEDKEPFFDTDKTIQQSVRIMTEMMREMEFVPAAMRRACDRGYLNATELADYLTGKDIPFREAHHITGTIVQYAEKSGKTLNELTLEELQSFSALIESDIFEALDCETAVARRQVQGGTGPVPVAAQIQHFEKWLESVC